MKKVTDDERRDEAWGRYVDWLRKNGLRFTWASQRAFMVGWAAKRSDMHYRSRALRRANRKEGKL